MPLLVLFILIPVFEIYLLIQVGGFIGWFPTLLIVIGTAVFGTYLLKQQGMATLARYRQAAGEGRLPAQEIIEGLALVFGGALLLTPGFFTDFVGFLCLIPLTRRSVIRLILQKVKLTAFTANQASPYSARRENNDINHSSNDSGRTFEADYEVKEK